MARLIKQGSVFLSLLIFFVACNFFLPALLGPYVLRILLYSCFNIILALSLNVVVGFCGQFSLGHAGFMAIGAYVSAALTTYGVPAIAQFFPWVSSFSHILFLGALLLGAAVSAFAGWLVGLPALRLRGDYLAIVTLGFGEIIRVLILNMDSVGGARGFIGIPARTNLFWTLFGTLLTLVLTLRYVHGSYGRYLKAIRDDEVAAQALGVNTTRHKVQAFIFGAFFAGLSGGLFAHYLAYLNPNSFTFVKSIEIIIMVVLGGMGSVSGTVSAAVLVTILPEALRPLQEITKVDLRMVLYSLILILCMLLRPAGLFGQREIYYYFKQLRQRLGKILPVRGGR